MKKKKNNNIDWFKVLFWGGFLILNINFWLIIGQAGLLLPAIIIYLLSMGVFIVAVVEEVK